MSLPGISDSILKRLRISDTAKAHGNNLSAGICRSFNGRCNRGIRAATAGVENFEYDDLERIADCRYPGAVLGRRGDGSGGMRAVAMVVLPGAGRGSDGSCDQRLTRSEEELAAMGRI